MRRRQIYCCGCGGDTVAILITGGEVYPHRRDLRKLPFWQCPGCGNFVGCHHKTKNPTRPLGVIATPAVKVARQQIHDILDPLWKLGVMRRKDIYNRLSKELGREYHTAEVRSVEEADKVCKLLIRIREGATNETQKLY